MSEKTAAPDDLASQVEWRGPRAKVLARRGEFDAACRVAQESVDLARQTDFLNLHGDALMDLADVRSRT